MQHERRETIMQMLIDADFVNAQELSSKFEVTSETIRRDLEYLEQMGYARRVHGGAVSIRRNVRESAFRLRQLEHTPEKRAIAEAAASFIEDGDTVLIAPGTTTRAVATFLSEKHDVTVITNSLPIATDLADCEGLNVFCLGGFVRADDYSVSGAMALENLKVFNANKLILGVGGITPEHGVTDYRMDESALLRTFIEKADCVIGMADCSKFGKVLRYNVCPASGLDHLITDSETPENLFLPYREEGVQVHVVPAEKANPEK